MADPVDSKKIFWSGTEIANTSFPEIGFLVDHIVPKVGVVLLHGKYGSYKTPLTVHLAHCVATGASFLGLVTQQARVLYIEGDTPMPGIWPRLQTMNPNTPAIDFAFVHPGLNVVSPKVGARNTALCDALSIQHAEHHYGLIIMDSLRTSHHLPDKDSEVPSIVYGAYAELFPGAVIMAIHHDRKTKLPERGARFPEPDEETDNESFSGSQAWIDRATTAIKLRRGYAANREWIALAQSKSQVGTLLPEPIQIHVTDGCRFALPARITDLEFTAALKAIGRARWRTKSEFDTVFAAHFNIPVKLAHIRRIEYESKVAPIK